MTYFISDLIARMHPAGIINEQDRMIRQMVAAVGVPQDFVFAFGDK